MEKKMELVKTFPTLYGRDQKDKIKQWSASVYKQDAIYICHLEFGLLDGKKQVSQREYTKGKNIGKQNETLL